MPRLFVLLIVLLAGCGSGTGNTPTLWEGSWTSGTRTGPATLNYQTAKPTGTILYHPTGEVIRFTIDGFSSAVPPVCRVTLETDYIPDGKHIILDCSTLGTYNLVVFPR